MTVASEPDRCPPSEVLAAFVDQRLSRNQVVALTEHLSTCAECRYVVESAYEARAEESASTVRRWWLYAAAAAIAAVFLLMPFARVQWRTYQRETKMRELVQELPKADRALSGRLTGFGYAPHTIVRGAPDEEKDSSQIIFEGKAAEVLDVTKGDDSPKAAHARGVADMILGDTDKAIEDLTKAAATNDPRAWSDLAAAYIAAKKYPEAVAAADRALKIDPKLNDARFNRAMAISYWKPEEEAKAWTEYLKYDPNSPWANEARGRID